MITLPETWCAPVVRGDFRDDGVWERLKHEIANPTDEGFRAGVEFVEDRALNVDFFEFARATDPDGVFRGFQPYRAHGRGSSTASQTHVPVPRHHHRPHRISQADLHPAAPRHGSARLSFPSKTRPGPADSLGTWAGNEPA
ncbi:hypothetical protein [Micromonospora sp. NBRC 101691]|uniref:DUF6924 domain-containing protein n=1 Tax=Micromonospora sp. NBRC 101691 TaxID=3032198 RepID=UPI0025563AFF|nr:hypothetical protein [Micromonospora sp. NBRC 101691]